MSFNELEGASHGTRAWRAPHLGLLGAVCSLFPRRLRSTELGCGRVGGTRIAVAIRSLPRPPCAEACHEALPSARGKTSRVADCGVAVQVHPRGRVKLPSTVKQHVVTSTGKRSCPDPIWLSAICGVMVRWFPKNEFKQYPCHLGCVGSTGICGISGGVAWMPVLDGERRDNLKRSDFVCSCSPRAIVSYTPSCSHPLTRLRRSTAAV